MRASHKPCKVSSRSVLSRTCLPCWSYKCLIGVRSGASSGHGRTRISFYSRHKKGDAVWLPLRQISTGDQINRIDIYKLSFDLQKASTV